MPFNAQSEHVEQSQQATLASDLNLGTADTNIAEVTLTNTSGAVETVTFRDSADTATLAIVRVPANSTRSFPGSHYPDGLRLQGTTNVTATALVYDPGAAQPAWTVGGGGGALVNATSTEFNPTTFNGRIEGPTDTAIFTSAPIGDFSFALWYEVDQTLAQFQGPIGSATSFALADGWGLYRGASDTVISFYVGVFSSDFDADFNPTNVWGTGQGWNHIAAAFDATNRQYTVWHNAVQMQSSTNAAPVSRPLGNFHTVGAAGTGGTSGAHFEGKVDEPAFWSGVILNQTQVTSLYNTGTPVDPTTVVSGADWYLRMGDDPSDDETVGTGQVTDQTANGNDFTPQGANTEVNFVSDVP